MQQQDFEPAPRPFRASVRRIVIGVVIGLALIGAAYAMGRWA